MGICERSEEESKCQLAEQWTYFSSYWVWDAGTWRSSTPQTGVFDLQDVEYSLFSHPISLDFIVGILGCRRGPHNEGRQSPATWHYRANGLDMTGI